MTTERFHAYRGDLRAVAVIEGDVAFVTVHPEGLPTAVYRLNPDNFKMSTAPLPAGGVDVLTTPEGLRVAGTDGRLYFQPDEGTVPAARGPRFDPAPVALAALDGGRLAVAAGETVRVVSRADGKELQSLALPEAATCLASDPTGRWLAVGGVKGTVAVFEAETDPAAFQQSDAATLHDAAVTALLFEPDELRFLSAGADQKLLSTHARGRLEAEDRGRGFGHEQPVAALAAGPLGRFFSGAADAAVKSWPPGKGARPVTQKDEVAKVVDLAVVPVHEKPRLVAACADNTLRFFLLDDEGKFGEVGDRLHGAADWAKNAMASSDPKQREASLRKLAGFADTASVEVIAGQMKSDADHALRLLACRLLGESKHPRAGKLLEKGLKHRDEAVRLESFDGLRRHTGPDDLRPIVLALKADKADVGRRAVEALEGLAKKDDQAMARLVEALDANAPEVRKAALAALEKVHAPQSPEASLTALGSAHADVRRLALVRLLQRELLHDPRVQGALRWRGDDADPEVRRVAFLLSLYTRERLVRALRQRDADLDRQLKELESGTLPALEGKPATAAAPGVASRTAATPAAPDAAGLLARAEELARAGTLPQQIVDQLKALQAIPGRPGAFGSLLQQIGAVIERLAGKGGKP
jgi:ParB family chromosome partitioning protein